MHIYFPLFTALNSLEGRPLHLKKRPYALYYFSLFCKNHPRETHLPFRFSKKFGFILAFFKPSSFNNFFSYKRLKKNTTLVNFYLKNTTCKKKNEFYHKLFFFFRIFSQFESVFLQKKKKSNCWIFYIFFFSENLFRLYSKNLKKRFNLFSKYIKKRKKSIQINKSENVQARPYVTFQYKNIQNSDFIKKYYRLGKKCQ